MKKRLLDLGVDQSGAITVIAALAMVVLIGFAALAVDIGRINVVKSELQKAADSGALAGAIALGQGSPCPNWSNNVAGTAGDTARENRVDGSLVASVEVQTGYWDLSWTPQTAPDTLKPVGIVPGPTDVPAVKVKVSKALGQNGGPLLLLFAPILGIHSASLSAQAVATMVMGVYGLPKGSGFPLATPISFVKQFWKSGETFRIGSNYYYPDGGQWTCFYGNGDGLGNPGDEDSSASTMKNLVENGNPKTLEIGKKIYIEPGAMTTGYNVADCKIGRTVMLPIVADGMQPQTWTEILAFVPFCITDVQGGSDKYIEGYFVKKHTVPGAAGTNGAPFFGAQASNRTRLVD